MFEVFEQLMPWIVSRCTPINGLITISDNSTSESIPSGTDYTKLTFPNASTTFAKNIQIDATTRDVTILKSGRYLLAFNFSSLSSVSNIILETVLLKNNEVVPSMHMKRQFSGVALISHATLTGVLELEKGDVIRIAVRHNHGSAVDLTVQYGNISSTKI